MKKMEQSAHIESLIRESHRREEQINRIQELYKICVEDFSQQAFTELIQLEERFTLPWVRRHLWSSGCYNDENEHEAMQESRLAVWNLISNADVRNDAIDNFAYYAFAIYKRRTADIIRKEWRKRKRLDLLPIDEMTNGAEGGGAGTIPPTYEDFGEKDLKRKVYAGVFRVYCISMLNSKAFPPRCLALCYARILPHLASEIPDTKAASAKWAYERMAQLSVWMLTQASEKTLKASVDKELAWGPRYIAQLDDEVIEKGNRIRLRDVIYTSVYDKDKIEDWAESMHKATLKEACRTLQEDQELMGHVKEYASTERVLRKVVKDKGEQYR